MASSNISRRPHATMSLCVLIHITHRVTRYVATFPVLPPHIMQVTIDLSNLVAFVALAVAAASYVHLLRRDLAEERRCVGVAPGGDVDRPESRPGRDAASDSSIRASVKRPANLYQDARRALDDAAGERCVAMDNSRAAADLSHTEQVSPVGRPARAWRLRGWSLEACPFFRDNGQSITSSLGLDGWSWSFSPSFSFNGSVVSHAFAPYARAYAPSHWHCTPGSGPITHPRSSCNCARAAPPNR